MNMYSDEGGERMDIDSGDGANGPPPLTMKEIIAKQNESNQSLIEKYCEKIQYQNMALYKLKYHREVYV